MPEPIEVRPARSEDLEMVAEVLVEGFRDKFRAAFGRHLERAGRVTARILALEAPRGLPGLYVAELDGRVAGTIALRRWNDPEPSPFRVLGILLGELGLWGGLRLVLYMSLLDQPAGRYEVYISDVAVAAPLRRRGVGRAMLTYAEEMARRWNLHALVLDVSAENRAAIRLYRQLGYREERTRSSFLTRWLLGEERWLRMRKDLLP